MSSSHHAVHLSLLLILVLTTRLVSVQSRRKALLHSTIQLRLSRVGRMFWKILFAAVLLLCGFSPPPSDPCGHWQASHAFAPLTAAAAAPVPTSVSRDMNLGSEPLSSGNSHTDSSSSRRSLMAFQRQLQQTASNVTVVTTAEQLQAAVVLGAVHIEVREHLNLMSLEGYDLEPLLSTLASTTKSIRV